MKRNHTTILAEVNRTTIDKFAFKEVQITLSTATEHVTVTRPDGTILATAQLGQQHRLPRTEYVFRRANGTMTIRLEMIDSSVVKAEVKPSSGCKEAAEFWADLMKTRIPEITIVFE